jgi:hypothetical protein
MEHCEDTPIVDLPVTTPEQLNAYLCNFTMENSATTS